VVQSEKNGIAMTILKPGMRLKSQVDNTQLMVVRAPDTDMDIRLGSHPVIDISAEPVVGLKLENRGEVALLGKRYGTPEGDLELLVTKADCAALTLGDRPIEIKQSKPLPASD
jgi:hypothetical protein